MQYQPSSSRLGYTEVFEIIESHKKEVIKSLKTRLTDIASLEENWNSYGAKPIPAETIDRAERIIKLLCSRPFIYPTACEGVQIEYIENQLGDYLELNVTPDGIRVFFLDGTKGNELIP